MSPYELQRVCNEINHWKQRALKAERDLQRARRALASSRAARNADGESYRAELRQQEYRWKLCKPMVQDFFNKIARKPPCNESQSA